MPPEVLRRVWEWVQVWCCCVSRCHLLHRSLHPNQRRSPFAQPLSRPVGKIWGGEGLRRALELYKLRYPHNDAILIGTGMLQAPTADCTIKGKANSATHTCRPYLITQDKCTSLSSMLNTLPNGALRIPGSPNAAAVHGFPTLFVVLADNPPAQHAWPRGRHRHCQQPGVHVYC